MSKINFHIPPKGYTYEFERDFKQNICRIWICNSAKFDYNGGAPSKSVWGFIHQRTHTFYAPIDSKRKGKQVELSQTTPYSAMQKLNNKTVLSD